MAFKESARSQSLRVWRWQALFPILVLMPITLVAASGLGKLSDIDGASLNISGRGFTWVTAMDGEELEREMDGKAGEVSVVDEDSDFEGSGFSTLDSMLQWAIGHSDPEKLKGAAQEIQRLTPKELEKRRADLKALMDHLRIPSDGELMKIAIADLQNSSLSAEEHQRALQELLVLVEPIDNANGVADLNKLGGLEALVHELERDEEELRTSAAWVLGKASQNNLHVQKQILRLGVLPRLINMVRSSHPEEAVKALYAVSALIRNFPYAQEKFHLEGGPELLQEIMSNTSSDIRLRRKSLFLVADLAEQQLEDGDQQVLHSADERLLKSVVDLMASPDLDIQEKALMAVRSLARLEGTTLSVLRDVCHVNTALGKLRTQLQQMMENEELAELALDMETLRQEVLKLVTSDNNDIREQ